VTSTDLIAAALHYDRSPEPYFLTEAGGRPRQGTGDSKYQATVALRNAGLVEEAVRNFNIGGLVGSRVEYVATPGLKIYLDALRSVPMPKQVWTMPEVPR